MATSRFLRMSTPLPNEIFSNHAATSMLFRPILTLIRSNKVELYSHHHRLDGGGGKNLAAAEAAAKCSLIVTEEKSRKDGVDLKFLLVSVADAMAHWRKFVTKPRPWGIHIQMLVEKTIVDCRFFTLLAISGSLLGSAPCFVEGCFMIVESYLQHFRSLPETSKEVHMVFQLIKAIDTYVMSTTMLVFALALQVMFMRASNLRDGEPPFHSSLESVASWLGVESAIHAKSKMGQVLIMILQMQLFDKSKSIAVSNSVDLAYFAATIFLSSASIFILSRIHAQI